MKIFDLCCSNGHKFEGWFESLEEMERQLAEGLLTCPVCGSSELRRLPSTFAIARSSSRSGAEEGPGPEEVARLLGRALKRYLEENFEDVGPRFAQEALKIHYGVATPRNIRGVSTPEEEKMLVREGVRFFKIGGLPELVEGPAQAEADEGEEGE